MVSSKACLATSLQLTSGTCSIFFFNSSIPAAVSLRPEQVEVHLLDQQYRYVKAFTVCPAEPLAATALDFDASVTVPAILQGYRDGSRAALEYAQYAGSLPTARSKRIIKLVPEAAAASAFS